jgi:AcrR family transcriptional regulator
VSETQSRTALRRQAALAEASEEYTAKRAELIHHAATVFKAKGYDAATLNDIAELFGTDRASLYYYVGSKEELLREAVKGVLDANVEEAGRILALPDASPLERLRLLVDRLITSYEENYPYMYVYIQEDMHKVAGEESPWAKQMTRQTRRFERAVITVINEGREQGAVREDIPTKLMSNALFGMLNWTHRWYTPQRKLPPHELSDAFCSIFLEGITRR